MYRNHDDPIAALQTSAEERVSQALEEYIAAIEAGRPILKRELLAHYSDVSSELAGCLDSLEFVHQVAPQLADGELASNGDGNSHVHPQATLGDFRIVRELGRGGMGVVYEAEQLSLGRRVALKVLPFAAMLDKQQLKRFKNEARAAATLDHPNIVAVHSVGEERGVHYYAMQLVEGQSLAELIAGMRQRAGERMQDAGGRGQKAASGSRERSDVSPPSGIHNPPPSVDTHPVAAISTLPDFDTQEYFRSVVKLGIQAAEALDHAHQQGVIHRDIKPANLLVDSTGKLWVTDFGLARVEADAGMTMTGDLLGTLRYMSPEQALAKRAVVDHRTDVYSLGVTLYELLAGRPAYDTDDRQELLKRIAFEEPIALRKVTPRIPQDLETILSKAVEKNPDDRYATSLDFAEDLQRFLSGKPIQARPPTSWHRVAQWSRRHASVVYTALTSLSALVLVLAVSVAQVTQSRNEEFTQRTVAEKAARIAEHQKELAILQRDLTLRNHYISSVQIAHSAWQQGNLGRMSKVLQTLAPKDDLPDLRGWEWYYLASLLHRNENVFEPDLGPVHQVKWNPSGSLLAVAGEEGVKIFESASLQRLHSIPDWQAFAWQPNGSFIAGITRTTPRRVVVWDTTTGKEIRSTSVGSVRIPDIRWRPNGSALAWISDTGKKTWIFGHSLHVWFIDEDEPQEYVYRDAVDSSGFRSLCWSPDGEAIVLGDSYLLTLVTWSVATKEFGGQERFGGGYAPDLSWCPQNGKLALATVQGKVRVSGPAPGEEITLAGHRGLAAAVVWSPDGKLLASAGEDNVVRVWHPTTWRQINVLAGHTGLVSSIDWSSIGDQIVSGSEDGSIRFWKWNERRDAAEVFRNGTMALDPTGKFLFTCADGWSGDPTVARSFQYYIVDSRTGHSLLKVGGAQRYGRAFSWSPDGKLVAGQRTEGVGIWDAATGRLVHHVPRPGCQRVAWSPDGMLFASCGTDGLAKIWQTSSGKLQQILHGHDETVVDARWSPDGRWLASADCSYGIKIWETVNWKPYCTIDPPENLGEAPVDDRYTIAWSPDSNKLASQVGRGRLVVWSLAGEPTPQLHWSTTAHTSAIRCIAWSPVGDRIASFSKDRLVRIWNADSGRELLSLDAKSHGDSLAWSPDGKRIIAGSYHAGVLSWDASPAMEAE